MLDYVVLSQTLLEVFNVYFLIWILNLCLDSIDIDKKF